MSVWPGDEEMAHRVADAIELEPYPHAPVWHAGCAQLADIVRSAIKDWNLVISDEAMQAKVIPKLIDRLVVRASEMMGRDPLKIVNDAGDVIELVHQDGRVEKIDPYADNEIFGAF